MTTSYFAGGCFWCIAPVMKIRPGVTAVRHRQAPYLRLPIRAVRLPGGRGFRNGDRRAAFTRGTLALDLSTPIRL